MQQHCGYSYFSNSPHFSSEMDAMLLNQVDRAQIPQKLLPEW